MESSDLQDLGDAAETAQTVARGELGEYNERFVPELHREMLLASEHYNRYAWASQLAPGRRVLDAGCGAGYGSELLAISGASEVTAVDVEQGAVTATGERLGDRGTAVRADLLLLPFPDDSFDLITCFEVIEHLADQPTAFGELRRVLAADGVLAISSPQRGSFPGGNPFHLGELTAAELEAALGERFANVAMFGQHPHYGSLIAPVATHEREHRTEPLEADLRRLSGTVPDEHLYTLALASDGDLPEPGPTAVLGGGVDVKAMVDAIGAWENRARRAEAERDLEAMDRYRAEFIREIAMERLSGELTAETRPANRIGRRLRRLRARVRRRLGR